MSAGHCTVGGALNVERFISVLPAAGVVVGAVWSAHCCCLLQLTDGVSGTWSAAQICLIERINTIVCSVHLQSRSLVTSNHALNYADTSRYVIVFWSSMGSVWLRRPTDESRSIENTLSRRLADGMTTLTLRTCNRRPLGASSQGWKKNWFWWKFLLRFRLLRFWGFSVQKTRTKLRLRENILYTILPVASFSVNYCRVH